MVYVSKHMSIYVDIFRCNREFEGQRQTEYETVGGQERERLREKDRPRKREVENEQSGTQKY